MTTTRGTGPGIDEGLVVLAVIFTAAGVIAWAAGSYGAARGLVLLAAVGYAAGDIGNWLATRRAARSAAEETKP